MPRWRVAPASGNVPSPAARSRGGGISSTAYSQLSANFTQIGKTHRKDSYPLSETDDVCRVARIRQKKRLKFCSVARSRGVAPRQRPGRVFHVKAIDA